MFKRNVISLLSLVACSTDPPPFTIPPSDAASTLVSVWPKGLELPVFRAFEADSLASLTIDPPDAVVRAMFSTKPLDELEISPGPVELDPSGVPLSSIVDLPIQRVDVVDGHPDAWVVEPALDATLASLRIAGNPCPASELVRTTLARANAPIVGSWASGPDEVSLFFGTGQVSKNRLGSSELLGEVVSGTVAAGWMDTKTGELFMLDTDGIVRSGPFGGPYEVLGDLGIPVALAAMDGGRGATVLEVVMAAREKGVEGEPSPYRIARFRQGSLEVLYTSELAAFDVGITWAGPGRAAAIGVERRQVVEVLPSGIEVRELAESISRSAKMSATAFVPGMGVLVSTDRGDLFELKDGVFEHLLTTSLSSEIFDLAAVNGLLIAAGGDGLVTEFLPGFGGCRAREGSANEVWTHVVGIEDRALLVQGRSGGLELSGAWIEVERRL
ncbi:MAG: hypothetical protein HYV07_20000 [Deltaproteobacteria bacterium]|nr:hypothetical protein [Deltaproteobacteria bacterium]